MSGNDLLDLFTANKLELEPEYRVAYVNSDQESPPVKTCSSPGPQDEPEVKEGRQWPKFSTLPTQLYHRDSFDILFEIVLFLSANYFAYGELLGVDHELLEAAARDSRNEVEASKKILLDWLDYQPGTGKKDRSWDTILDTMNEINKSDAQAMVDRLLKLEKSHKQPMPLKKSHKQPMPSNDDPNDKEASDSRHFDEWKNKLKNH